MYSFYADESGTCNLKKSDQPWYVLLAVGFNDDNWKLIDDAIIGLKKTYFPSWNIRDVEIRSNDIRRAPLQKWPEDGNPFSTLSPENLKRFSDDLYRSIDGLPLQFCAVAVDKQATVLKHGLKQGSELFTLAYTLLIERLHGWANQEKSYARLFLDQQENNLLGIRHDSIIEDHYNLSTRGTGWQDVSRIIERPYFEHSKHCSHVQIADILAYNIYRRFVLNDPAYIYYRLTMKKVRGNAKPDGSYYGLKVYP